LEIGDWGLGIGPPIPNPQSPIPNPQSPKYYKFKIIEYNFKIILNLKKNAFFII